MPKSIILFPKLYINNYICTNCHCLLSQRLLFATEKWTEENKQELDTLISQYLMENGSDTTTTTTQLEHITLMTRTTEKDQFLLLSTISNFHWNQYPSLQATSVISKTRSTRYLDHIVFDPDEKQHVPTSPCNCLLHLQMSENNYTSYMNTYIDFLLNQDKEPEGEEMEPTCSHNDQHSKRKRKHAARTVHVHPSAIYKECGIDMNENINCASENRNVFTKFKEQLLSEGVIKWRYHTTHKDIVCMNDMDSDTGVLKPNDFVLVTCIKNFSDENVISCTCELCNVIRCAGHQEHTILPEEQANVYPDTSMTCLHCRFYKYHLVNAHTNIVTKAQNDYTRSELMVSNSLQYMNEGVILLGSTLCKSTTKFSAKGEDNHSTHWQIQGAHPACAPLRYPIPSF